ncbi:MAG: hypothetical protein ACRDGN_13470, partial [bacterium]
RLGVGAHASFVLRTRSGRFEIAQSLTLEEVGAATSEDGLATLLVSSDEALDDLPAVELTASQRQQVLEGRPLPLFQIPGWAQVPVESTIRLRDTRGLVALARVEAGRLRPFRVLRVGHPRSGSGA